MSKKKAEHPSDHVARQVCLPMDWWDAIDMLAQLDGTTRSKWIAEHIHPSFPQAVQETVSELRDVGKRRNHNGNSREIQQVRNKLHRHIFEEPVEQEYSWE